MDKEGGEVRTQQMVLSVLVHSLADVRTDPTDLQDGSGPLLRRRRKPTNRPVTRR